MRHILTVNNILAAFQLFGIPKSMQNVAENRICDEALVTIKSLKTVTFGCGYSHGPRIVTIHCNFVRQRMATNKFPTSHKKEHTQQLNSVNGDRSLTSIRNRKRASTHLSWNNNFTAAERCKRS